MDTIKSGQAVEASAAIKAGAMSDNGQRSGEGATRQGSAADVSCCSQTEQASCCEPAAKASCCGNASSGGCGCR